MSRHPYLLAKRGEYKADGLGIKLFGNSVLPK